MIKIGDILYHKTNCTTCIITNVNEEKKLFKVMLENPISEHKELELSFKTIGEFIFFEPKDIECDVNILAKNQRYFQYNNDKITGVNRSQKKKITQINEIKDTVKASSSNNYVDIYAAVIDKIQYYYPEFDGLIHITECSNLIDILREGYLKSRNLLEKEGKKFSDKADHNMLDRTNNDIKNYARFYYREGTPTHYTAKYNSPAIMVFDKEILGKKNVIFSYGNPASRYSVIQNDLRRLLAYDWWNVLCRSSIKGITQQEFFHNKSIRCSEILYPEKISTAYLRKIIFSNEYDKNIVKEQAGYDYLLEVNEKRFINWGR